MTSACLSGFFPILDWLLALPGYLQFRTRYNPCPINVRTTQYNTSAPISATICSTENRFLFTAKSPFLGFKILPEY